MPSTTPTRPFKEEIDATSIAALARAMASAEPTFPVRRFTRRAGLGLGALELKARVAHVAGALDEALADRPFPVAAELVASAVEASLAPPAERPEGLDPLDMWAAWPAQTWVETAGLEHPMAALDAIGRITPAASGEFAVRAYLEAHPALAMDAVHRWAADPDEHRRRLASECTRPRLPWGRRLRRFVTDPSPVLDVLDRLVCDDSSYVRRSVANNLNDIAKDHPDLAVEVAERWSRLGDERATGVVRHGLRTLVKHGDPAALAVLGYRADAPVSASSLRADPPVATIGEEVRLEVELTAGGAVPVPVVVDYVVHRPLADGSSSAKVFKWTTRTLTPGRSETLRKRHPLRVVSVRTLRPGEHLVEVQVNGQMVAATTFELRAP